MFRYVVVRLWLADRPGSLGRIATKIGELGGDLVGIDILERNGARAVDELTVELPGGHCPEALADALSKLPGVEVEDLRHRVSEVPYAGPDPLDAAVLLTESTDPTELSNTLAQSVCNAFACDWCAVLDMSGARAVMLAHAGDPPGPAWLGAFAVGRARASRCPSAVAKSRPVLGTSPGRRLTCRVSWSSQAVMARHFEAVSAGNSTRCAASPTTGGASSSAQEHERRCEARGGRVTRDSPPCEQPVPHCRLSHRHPLSAHCSAERPDRGSDGTRAVTGDRRKERVESPYYLRVTIV